jgi:hypothetical protein
MGNYLYSNPSFISIINKTQTGREEDYWSESGVEFVLDWRESPVPVGKVSG